MTATIFTLIKWLIIGVLMFICAAAFSGCGMTYKGFTVGSTGFLKTARTGLSPVSPEPMDDYTKREKQALNDIVRRY